jgi:hypothetical protein
MASAIEILGDVFGGSVLVPVVIGGASTRQESSGNHEHGEGGGEHSP